MTVETSNKILKIFGILGIIGGALSLILGLVASFGGSLVTEATEDETAGFMVVFIGIIMVISGIVSLIEGIFSVRAAKDNSKIGSCLKMRIEAASDKKTYEFGKMIIFVCRIHGCKRIIYLTYRQNIVLQNNCLLF